MIDAWWDIHYPIRRNLKITPKFDDVILSNHPIYCFIDKDKLVTLKKVKENFEDLEVLYVSGNQATPVWHRLGRQVSYDQQTDLITILFNSYEEITEENTNYYLYMANDVLFDWQLRPTYESSVYVLKATPQNNSGIMFSRPGEDWNDGESTTTGAKATLGFLGINVKITLEKGPDKGILELKLDENEPIFIDCYSATTSDVVVYEKNDLSKERHYIRMSVTGNKSPSSSSNKIKIVSIEYSKFIEAFDKGEEFYPIPGPINAIVGL
jgi:hypothetical protein